MREIRSSMGGGVLIDTSSGAAHGLMAAKERVALLVVVPGMLVETALAGVDDDVDDEEPGADEADAAELPPHEVGELCGSDGALGIRGRGEEDAGVPLRRGRHSIVDGGLE